MRLSLVSSRPVSFVMDLYTPLFVNRPVVMPELYASLRPQTYEEGIVAEAKGKDLAEREMAKAEAYRRNSGPAAPMAAVPGEGKAADEKEEISLARGDAWWPPPPRRARPRGMIFPIP